MVFSVIERITSYARKEHAVIEKSPSALTAFVNRNAAVITLVAIVMIVLAAFNLMRFREEEKNHIGEIKTTWRGTVTTDLDTYSVEIHEKIADANNRLVRFVHLEPVSKSKGATRSGLIIGQDFRLDGQWDIIFMRTGDNSFTRDGDTWVWQHGPVQLEQAGPDVEVEIKMAIEELNMAMGVVYNDAHKESLRK